MRGGNLPVNWCWSGRQIGYTTLDSEDWALVNKNQSESESRKMLIQPLDIFCRFGWLNEMYGGKSCLMHLQTYDGI